METVLAGVNGLNAKMHKTDDVWFVYVTIDGTKIQNEQLLFKTKKQALKWFDEVNARLQA